MLVRVPKNQIKSLRLALLLIEHRMEVNLREHTSNEGSDKLIREESRRILCAINNVLHQTWRKVRCKKERRR